MHLPPHAPVPAGLGTKFWPDGRYRRYPGNTVVAMVEPGSPVWAALGRVRAVLDPPLGPYMTFLPPDSWHMTAFDLLLDEVRRPERWSRFLDLDAPLTEADTVLRAAVEAVPPPEPTLVGGVLRAQPGVVFDVHPVDADMERALRSYRERLSDATGIRAPDHRDYRFHVTMAYLITHPPIDAMATITAALTEAEELLAEIGAFTLERPSFRCFSDMGAFLPQRSEAGLWVPEPDPTT